MAMDPLDEIFAKIHEAFAARGLLRRALRVAEAGRAYSLRCDDDCFTVYRINQRPFLPPGEPGWTVCRLERKACFSLEPGPEACPLPQDEARLAAAREWVTMALRCLAAAPPEHSEE
ncbi:MAG: hypothetical protein ACOZHQ_16320 [Thermodesulfobacteriota bacterium]